MTDPFLKMNKEWYEHCVELIDGWFRRCIWLTMLGWFIGFGTGVYYFGHQNWGMILIIIVMALEVVVIGFQCYFAYFPLKKEKEIEE